MTRDVTSCDQKLDKIGISDSLLSVTSRHAKKMKCADKIGDCGCTKMTAFGQVVKEI